MNRDDRIRHWFLWGLAAFTVFMIMGQIAGPLNPRPVSFVAAPAPRACADAAQSDLDLPSCPATGAIAIARPTPRAIVPTATIAVEGPAVAQPSGAVHRTGATCGDGSSSSATGSGACSHHGGVGSWTYASDAPVAPVFSTRLCGGTRYIGNIWNKLLFPPGTDIKSIDPVNAACFDTVAEAAASGYELRP